MNGRAGAPATTAVATYRVQLEARFDFDAASAELEYLAALGISHLYTSPVWQARSGSAHGYDVVDPTRASAALGGERAFARLCQRARQLGMGVMIDIVPNHMAISVENPWWWDVLEYGRASRYAGYFDIQWDDGDATLVLPLLPDRYWRVLTGGGIGLVRERGALRVRSGETLLPASPESQTSIWNALAEESHVPALAALAAELPATDAAAEAWQAFAAATEARLEADAAAAAALDAALEALNRSPARLDVLLEQQHYRLAFWRSAQTELSYRRFFDIDTLIGLRVEDPAVFAAVHSAVLNWTAAGDVDGLRVDHIDGLRDPTGYLHRLRAAAPRAWIVVEKILARDERLPDWPVEGTTGYDFLARVGGLFVDPDGAAALQRVVAEFLGAPEDYAAIARAARLEVLHGSLAADVQRLTSALSAICTRHRRVRDFARAELAEALCELIAAFPVYRGYARNGEQPQVSDADRATVAAAQAAVRAARPDIDELLLDFLARLACLEIPGAAESDFALRLQQLTGPAMAKGVEDTACYRSVRLVSLNEVGDDPGRAGVSPEAFHAANRAAQHDWPRALLATATHDTKRGEDVRARLALLSEMPTAWRAALSRWTARNAVHRGRDDIGRAMELLCYQTMVGAWPIDADRLVAYLIKAAREAKQRTTWIAPDEAYEAALTAFARGVRGDLGFVADLERFVAPLVALGRVNALAQLLLKTTAPGVPDVYQGCELWDLSLVDPDNRRPVDYQARRRLLAGLDDATPEALLRRADEGLPKLWTLRQALAVRRRRPECFGADGDYAPLPATGARAEHCVAFVRGGRVATIVPRLVARLRDHWRDTAVELPFARWRNVLTGERGGARRVEIGALLRRFPIALVEEVE